MLKNISIQQKNIFSSESVLLIKDFIDKGICEETCTWLEKNENKIIQQFKNDKRGLVLESFENKEFIKYFEHPLFACPKIFTQYLTSKVFNYASELLDSEVIFKSLEIHSRFPGSEIIPMHQDNAYYGLDNGKALTFYVPINKQFAEKGGLKYLAIKNSNDVYEHKASNSSAFSLEIKEKEKVYEKHKKRFFNFNPGDCTAHFSNSIHFANEVPLHARRCWVVRFSFYSCKASIKDGHREWYQKMINVNRVKN